MSAKRGLQLPETRAWFHMLLTKERRSPTRDVFPAPDRLQLRPMVHAVAIACQVIGDEWQRAQQWQAYLAASR
jgi:hypothetical protein